MKRISVTCHQCGCCLTALVVFFSSLVMGCSRVRVSRLYDNGAVASAAPLATDVGIAVLKKGGNAFDAAVAVGLALAVVHPEAGNIGGGGFALVRVGKSGQIRVLDFRETAPAAASDSMFLDSSGAVIAGLSLTGARASGVPGTVAGLYDLWHEYGSRPWEELVTIAAGLADTGFVVDEYLAASLSSYRAELTRFNETAQIFYPGGRAIEAGERLAQPNLAKTLYLLAAEGPQAFYRGQIADSIEQCMTKYGGLITKSDLADYRTLWREPLHFSFDCYDIYSVPPPSSGGVMIGQILKLLEPFEFAAYTSASTQFIHLFCQASRLAFADRSQYLGDPAFCQVPTTLLSPDYLNHRRQLIKLGHVATADQIGPGSPPVEESEQTTHFSIYDKEGNAVALTYTLNAPYGSKLVVTGAGFLLNNEMDDFSIKPGTPNRFGLVGGEANKIEPGKRMLSSMSPTIVLKDGRPHMILGAPGGSKIITVVAQALLNDIRFHMDAPEICRHARFHDQWLPDALFLEKGGFTAVAVSELTSLGHRVEECAPYSDLQLIRIDETGLVAPASDPRKRGKASGY
jgi:gamma-glutamyltranspeptidase/glutathione hydrolase